MAELTEDSPMGQAIIATDKKFEALVGDDALEGTASMDPAALFVGLPVDSEEANEYAVRLSTSYISDVTAGRVDLTEVMMGVITHALIAGMVLMENDLKKGSE